MRLRSEFGAEPLTRPLGSSSGTPLLHSIQPWRFPRPRPNLPLGLPHSRAGFSSARRARRKVFRRSNGGDWTEGLIPLSFGTFASTPALLYVIFISANTKGGNDETRSYHNRNCGHFGSDRLGGGGECTIWP